MMFRDAALKKEIADVVVKLEDIKARISADQRSDYVVNALLDLARIVQKLAEIQRIGF